MTSALLLLGSTPMPLDRLRWCMCSLAQSKHRSTGNFRIRGKQSYHTEYLLCLHRLSHVHAIFTIMKRVASAALWPRLRTLQIYGANTGVGKTIFSTVLCRAFQRKLQRVQYVKPVSTGPLDDADDRYAFLVYL